MTASNSRALKTLLPYAVTHHARRDPHIFVSGPAGMIDSVEADAAGSHSYSMVILYVPVENTSMRAV